MKDGEKVEKYATISLPIAIMRVMDDLINELGYWPSRGAFVREACLEKIHRERRRLKDLKDTEENDDDV